MIPYTVYKFDVLILMQGCFDFARHEVILIFTYSHVKRLPTTKLDTEEKNYRRWQRKSYSKKIPISHLSLLVSATAATPVVGRSTEPDCFS